MLILTRRPAETIYIGGSITVTVLGVVGNQVRFGIEAPRSVVIDRAEIHERKKQAALKKAAGDSIGNLTPEALKAFIEKGAAAQAAVDELVAKEVNGKK